MPTVNRVKEIGEPCDLTFQELFDHITKLKEKYPNIMKAAVIMQDGDGNAYGCGLTVNRYIDETETDEEYVPEILVEGLPDDYPIISCND